MNIHAVYAVFQRHFRPKRIRRLKQDLPMLQQAGTRVLDVGGVAAWWQQVQPTSSDIMIVNLDGEHRTECLQAGYKFMVADARELPFADGEFDLVHSNSVIEHVGDFNDQRRCADEMRRCGRAIYMQTPNLWFPVEPHLITVFIHWLPFAMQRRLVRWFSVWGLVNKPSQAQIDDFLRGTRLLSRREVEALFPGMTRSDEKFFGLTKSFVVVGTPGAAR